MSLRRCILALLLSSLALTSFGQPRYLAEQRHGIETARHLYDLRWVCRGDTLATDTTAENGAICLIDGFWITCTEITRDMWHWYLLGEQTPDSVAMLPQRGVSLKQVNEFLRVLGVSINQQWRLPTLDEWQFAYHGGLFSEHYRYSGSDNADFVAWTVANSGHRTHPVAQLIPNELGLYDMAGNVAEMVTGADGICFVGGSCVDRPECSDGRPHKADPEMSGLRIVRHEPLWFDRYGQRIFRP